MREKRNVSKESGRDPIWKIILYMFFMGLISAFIIAHAHDSAVRIGFSPETAQDFPTYAFVVGAVSGIFRAGRNCFQWLLMWASFWFIAYMFGVGIGALSIILGASTRVADRIPPIFFGISVVLSALAIFAGPYDKLQGLMARREATRDTNAGS